MIDRESIIESLSKWKAHSGKSIRVIPDRPNLEYYGTGYNSWGVQTNQKYLAAMASLASTGDEDALERALASLRFSLWSHLSGDGACSDGTQWGHTWISGLGVERMMYGVHLLESHLAEEDRDALRRMLVSESDWLLRDYQRGGHRGVHADLWGASGKNAPESNIWNGAVLWRTAEMYPDEPDADAWKDMARDFLINGVSVPADEEKEPRFVGANFFPHFALDHHRYMNVGYMVICVSNAAILHFDMKAAGLDRPEELDHHQADLWEATRRMIFHDGRLARIGGDSRLRYAYCQDYLLPSLLYAADRLDDPHAPEIIEGLVRLMLLEQRQAEDGGYFSKRLSELERENPYYYTRLESDRACALGMALAWQSLVKNPPEPEESFENSVAGGWCEPGHGDILHRSPRRLASFSWRAKDLGQGLCLPPEASDLAEWQRNLTSCVRFVGYPPGEFAERRLIRGNVTPFDGGFMASGALVEGAKVVIQEGWKGEDLAIHPILFVALPDGRTVVGLERMQTGPRLTYVIETLGMHLNIPNDLYNDMERNILFEDGGFILRSPSPEERELIPLESRWASIDGSLFTLGLYGADEMVVRRSSKRRAGPYPSLYIEELCWGGFNETREIEPNSIFLDIGWATACGAGDDEARDWAEMNPVQHQDESTDVRLVTITGFNDKQYLIAANFGASPEKLEIPEVKDLCSGSMVDSGECVIDPGEGRAFEIL